MLSGKKTVSSSPYSMNLKLSVPMVLFAMKGVITALHQAHTAFSNILVNCGDPSHSIAEGSDQINSIHCEGLLIAVVQKPVVIA